jgi:hypothetical protein
MVVDRTERPTGGLRRGSKTFSSAREISGQSRRAVAVTAQPIRRIFDSMDAITNLHAVFESVVATEAVREADKFWRAKRFPGFCATFGSRPQAATRIHDRLVTAEIFGYGKCGAVLRFALRADARKSI